MKATRQKFIFRKCRPSKRNTQSNTDYDVLDPNFDFESLEKNVLRGFVARLQSPDPVPTKWCKSNLIDAFKYLAFGIPIPLE